MLRNTFIALVAAVTLAGPAFAATRRGNQDRHLYASSGPSLDLDAGATARSSCGSSRRTPTAASM